MTSLNKGACVLTSALICAGLLISCGPKTGDVTFWQDVDEGFGITVVEIEGISANITGDHTSEPNCGAEGSATFSLEYGTHNYVASDGGAGFWNGSVEIDGSCSTVLLTKRGDVTFWQKTGDGFSETLVEIDGSAAEITSEYDNEPECGASGCATFNLPHGTYEFIASDGVEEWPGTVVVDGLCLVVLLE